MGSIFCCCFRFKDLEENNATGSHTTGSNKNAAIINHDDSSSVLVPSANNGLPLLNSNSASNTSAAAKVEAGFSYMFASHDDEDVCPTCLEEYTYDNPRIVTRCNHHYHLGCIYEWKERSETCPVCAKVLVFDEAS